MKIVDRKTFLALPINTLYSKFEPNCFGRLEIKGQTLEDLDWYSVDLASSIAPCEGDKHFDEIVEDDLMAGASVPVCFDVVERDGLYEEEQLFAVWEPDDIKLLIARLSECLE